MSNPYANLQIPDIGGHVQQRFEAGAKFAREREIRRTSAQAMGGDQNALLKLYSLDPGTARGIEDQLYQRGERQREGDYRGALGDLMLGQGGGPSPTQPNALMQYAQPQSGGNALGGMGQGSSWGQPPAPPRDPLAPLPEGSNGTAGGGGLTARTAAPSPYTSSPYSTPGIGDGLPGNRPAASVGGMDARSRAIRANPEGFLTFQGKQLQVGEAQLKNLKTVNDFGMQILGGVHDQATYDQGRAMAAQVYQQHGLDPSPITNLPPQYSPELIDGLRMQGMDADKQVQAIVRENRLQWDMEDDRLDNQRSDRNTQSLISHRNRPPRPTGRQPAPKGPTPTSVIGAIMDKQARGEALTPAERQTLTEYRAPKGRGRGGNSAAPVAMLNGRKITVRGGKWVYQDNGKPAE